MSSLEQGWFTFEGLRIRYARQLGSASQPPMLIFNGVGQNLETMQPLVDALPDMPIIIYDVPGIGLSEAPSYPWRFSQHAKLAAQLVCHLGYQKINVLGVSWGGGLAQQFAKQFPTMCKKLVLVSTMPGNIFIPGNPLAYLAMASPLRLHNKTFMRKVAGIIYGGDVRNNQGVVQQLTALRKAPPSQKSYAFQVSALYGWSSLCFLSQLQQPTLILHGEDDPLIPAANAKLMARLINNSQLELFDCGHLMVLTRINKIAPLIRSFVQLS